MSQRTLASRSGIDPSTISRLERGVASTTTLSVLSRVAEGLGCTAEELMIVTASSSGKREIHRHQENLVELQRALIGTSLDAPDSPRTPPRLLAEQIAAVRDLRRAGSYRLAAIAAARCLPAAHAAIRITRDRKQASGHLVHVCFDAAMSGCLLGDLGTAWIAAERMQEAAALTRQSLLMAGATFARAYVALGRVVPSRARQIIESYTNGMTPKTPEFAAVLGMLHLTAALATSRSRGRRGERDLHLTYAARMVPLVDGDSDPFALYFNHETYWQWRMNIGLEARDRSMATEALAQIDLNKIVEPHLQAVYFVDLARLYASSGRWEGAVHLLARADRLAPEYVRHCRAAQKLADYLVELNLGEPASSQLSLLRARDSIAVNDVM